MLKNYFKIALAVLKRRKFFTFISLFGISFTLTILMVTTALIDKVLSPAYPDYRRDRSLYISQASLLNTKEGWYNGSSVSFRFLNDYVAKMKTPEKVGIFTFSSSANAYVNNKKLVIEYKYTNAPFWEIAEFDFLEGKPYNEQQVQQAARVAVITDRTATKYFGRAEGVTGKYIELDNVNYRVSGVVKGIPRSNRNFYGEIYLPYSVSKNFNGMAGTTGVRDLSVQDRFIGKYGAVLLARSEADVPAMRAEYAQLLKKVFKPQTEYDKLYIHAESIVEGLARNIFGNNEETGIVRMFTFAALLVFLFLLLPTINLVNINITRIMERSSEIGVRKAFGASSRTLVYQFLIENIILTLLGGLIGLVLSSIAIYMFNQADILPDLNLALNLKVLVFGLLLCLVFGFLSGVYPAWRMSRMNVVYALKAK